MESKYENAGGSSSTAGAAAAQLNADGQLLAQFENSGKLFNYAKSVPHSPQALISEEKIAAYLSKNGCTLAIEPRTFEILAYSQNCFDMLGVSSNAVDLMGSDYRNLFTPSSNDALSQAVDSTTETFPPLHPISVHAKANHRPFFAIFHAIDVGVIIDLEPAAQQPDERSFSCAIIKGELV